MVLVPLPRCLLASSCSGCMHELDDTTTNFCCPFNTLAEVKPNGCMPDHQPCTPLASPMEIFCPGRLCLFGEHSDWAGEYRMHDKDSIAVGRTIVVGTQQGLHATAQALQEPVLELQCTLYDGATQSVQLPLELEALLAEAQNGGFFSYAAGTAYRVLISHHVGGLRINNHHTTLPASKGLSSSAAVCVMVARAFNLVYGLKLTTRGEMELAYTGETTTPSKCGRMDQACAFGCVPVLMTFDADILHIQRLKLAVPLHLVVVDLGAAKDTTTILRCLQAAYPRPETDHQRRLVELLGNINLNITQRALQAMSTGDLQALGLLMCEAQQEFDARAGPLCPEQLTAPKLHMVLSHTALQPLIWGGKGVGSQGDGTAQLLCKGPDAQQQVFDIVTAKLKMHAMLLTVDTATA